VVHSSFLHNGEIRPSGSRSLSAGQAGLLNGWGVFSTIKVTEGVLFAFERHWARMRRDASLLRVPFTWTEENMQTALLDLVAANRAYNSTLRVVVVRNRGSFWEGPGVERDADLIAFTADRGDWGGSVRLGVVHNARHASGIFAGTKVTSWAENLVWYEEAHLRGHDEAVLLNHRDEVSECTSANIFAVFGAEAVTPPLSSGCLPGITRQLLLEQIRVPGITVREAELTLPHLERADSLFITSSTRDLLPVQSVEGLSIKRETDVTNRLAAAFNQYESAYVRAAARRTPEREHTNE
jgi:branched-chain amino acid aminotransferase